MSSLLKTEGFLLRSVDYADSHRILTFLSPEHGQVSVMALGAKKSKNRSLGLLDYLRRLDLDLESSRPHAMLRLKSLRLIESYPWVEEDYQKSLQALDWCAKIRQALQPSPDFKEIYGLLHHCLKALKALPVAQVDLVFNKQLLAYLGYELNLSSCGDCDKEGKGEFFFAAKWGSLFCKNCAPGGGEVLVKETLPNKLVQLESVSSLPQESLCQAKAVFKRAWEVYVGVVKG